MYSVSSDIINMVLKQMGAVSVKSVHGQINIVKFQVAPNVKLTYIYEVKEEEGIYLQRVNPYPLLIGKLYNEKDIIDYIEKDYKKFVSAYNSSNFPTFLGVTNHLAAFNRQIENLFMTKNVPAEGLERIEEQLKKIDDIIADIENTSPDL